MRIFWAINVTEATGVEMRHVVTREDTTTVMSICKGGIRFTPKDVQNPMSARACKLCPQGLERLLRRHKAGK